MTTASASRVARRVNGQHAAPPIEGRAFLLPPAGMLSEQVDLPDYELAMGLVHPEGSPILIAVWDGKRMRRLLPDQAAKWADEIALTPGLGPVIEAIRALVKRAGDIVVASMMRTEGSC